MYRGYYTDVDGRRQFHYNSCMCQSGHHHCLCVHRPIVNNNWEWNKNITDYSPMRIPSTKKIVLKKQSHKSTKDFGLTKFLRLSLAKSSVSGINSIASSKSVLAKIIWALVFVCSLGGFSYQTFGVLQIYRNRPTIVITDIENSGKAIFPAVTICNHNRIRKSIYCKYYQDKCQNGSIDVAISESEILNLMYTALEENDTKKKIEFGHNKSMIYSCVFSGYPSMNETECLNNLRIIFDPFYGNCIVIPAENQQQVPLEAHEADFWREDNTLTVLLDIQKKEFTEKNRKPGVSVIIHPGTAFADVGTDGHNLMPGRTHDVGIQKTTIVYLPLPYKTNCTNFEELLWDKKDKIMTSRICSVRCSQYYQLKNCGFVVQKLSLFYETLPWGNESITPEQKECAEKEENATKSLCTSVCSVPCSHSIFEIQRGQNTLTHQEIKQYRHDERYINNKEYLQNLVFMKISYKNLEHRIFRHKPLYNTMELFSFLGGYSGVWLGFSLLTIYELLEIVLATFRFFLFKRNKKVKQKRVVPAVPESKKQSLKGNALRSKNHFYD